MPFPFNWKKASLKDTCQIIMGQSPPSKTYNTEGQGLPFFQGKAEFGKKFPTPLKYCRSPQKIAEKSDILISVRAPVGPTNICVEKSCIGRGLAALRPVAVTSEYLFYFLRFIEAWITTQGTGSTFSSISRKHIETIEIPVAPLNEQQRIAAKLEKLLAKVDQCQARLEKIPGILKRFRNAVIAGACAGALTKNWRDSNPEIQNASHVLEDNIKERTKKYQSACHEAKQQGKSKPRAYKVENESINDAEYQWLPETWKLERLCNIAQICGGVTKGRKLKNRTTITLPYLRVANVQDGYLDLSEIKHIEALPEDLDKYGLKKGDVLFTEGGDRDKLGRGTVWNDEIEDCIHQNHIFRARLYSSNILPEYVSLATKSEQSRNFFFKNASQTVNLASINMTSLGNLPIPIPPYEEQKEIIKRVKTLYEIADQLEKRYSKGRIHIDNLTQSILAKAFRGELVPQDPDDEPASELLERIQAEKADCENKGRKKASNQKQRKVQKTAASVK